MVGQLRLFTSLSAFVHGPVADEFAADSAVGSDHAVLRRLIDPVLWIVVGMVAIWRNAPQLEQLVEDSRFTFLVHRVVGLSKDGVPAT